MFENISIIGPGLWAQLLWRLKKKTRPCTYGLEVSRAGKLQKTQWCDCVHENLENSVRK